MKKLSPMLLISQLTIISTFYGQNIAINGGKFTDTSAILDVSSVSKGF
ncbi:MAG: hypothetical protein WKI04_06750 [Ferruginibacter sp.]